MSQKTKTPKKQVKIPLNVYLGYLLILTFVFTAVSFARFAVSEDSGGTARVASFTVSAAVGAETDKTLNFSDASQSFATSQSASYNIAVTNVENGKAAEVAVGYDVIITIDSSYVAAEALSLSIDGTQLTASQHSGKLVYTYAATPMPANEEIRRNHTLTVTVHSQYVDADIENMPLSVSVLFEQID